MNPIGTPQAGHTSPQGGATTAAYLRTPVNQGTGLKGRPATTRTATIANHATAMPVNWKFQK